MTLQPVYISKWDLWDYSLTFLTIFHSALTTSMGHAISIFICRDSQPQGTDSTNSSSSMFTATLAHVSIVFSDTELSCRILIS